METTRVVPVPSESCEAALDWAPGSREVLEVLVIEDNEAHFQLVKRALARCQRPYRVWWATTIAAGIGRLEAQRIDVVLTDLGLPDGSGLEAVHRIRSRFELGPPIVVLTALDDAAVEMQALDAGAQDYLSKDLASGPALELAIRHAIGRDHCRRRIVALLTQIGAQREQLEEQKQLLEHKNRRLRKLYRTAHRFVDNVSHEFRTPLTVIKDYIALVQEGLVGPISDQQRQFLAVASVRVDDLNNMVDDMLDASKLESGLLGIRRRACTVREIVEAVQPALGHKAAVRNVDYSIDLPADLPRVYCDSDKASRVVMNLVTNAMKFCGEPGRVRLWASAQGDQGRVQIGVTDNGPGIEAEQLEVIFKRFRQLRQPAKGSTKGFGLGLNIARDLAEINLGQLSVESIVGEGATFWFTLPVAEPPWIARHYLDYLARHGLAKAPLSLAALESGGDAAAADVDDLDAFLHFLLRQHDLLFRLEGPRWLLVLEAPEVDRPRFEERLKRELEKADRNRLAGPLPAAALRWIGTWRGQGQAAAFLEALAGAAAAADHSRVAEPGLMGQRSCRGPDEF